MTKQRAVTVILAAAAITVASILYGHHLPLYDGIGAPDELYRYAQIPAALKTSKFNTTLRPTTAEQLITLKNGKNSSFVTIQSQEVGPQVALYFYATILEAPTSASKIAVSAAPRAPDNNKPHDGEIAGNIYRLSAVSNASGSVTFKATHDSSLAKIQLRLPQTYLPGANVEYRTTSASSWTKLSTTRVGNDIYEASLSGFGDYALVVGKTAASTDTSKQRLTVIAIIAAFFVLVVLLVLLIRVQAKTSHSRHDDKS